MNELMKSGLWFVAGVVVGAVGVNYAARQDNPLRGVMVGTLAQGIAVKEKVFTSLEKAKENVEDMVAEAKHVQSGDRQVPEKSK
ncbi:Protein of unknown function [Desulfonatronum thiosulfatophilum]|uniref:Uncharacterized protein n=1 Tax=Desulfonatronum thiosulfatophilum TaxID=617002 RepID=A0A1G6EVZ5_9BACT|nr:DUF1490 family protein [Desulfonatronum thiosulfatophilum]SDB61644.1 Protein of unknown function [Desulfonatronum thiosulfatophilum]